MIRGGGTDGKRAARSICCCRACLSLSLSDIFWIGSSILVLLVLLQSSSVLLLPSLFHIPHFHNSPFFFSGGLLLVLLGSCQIIEREKTSRQFRTYGPSKNGPQKTIFFFCLSNFSCFYSFLCRFVSSFFFIFSLLRRRV